MKIAILGFGREGKSVLKFIFKHGFTQIRTQINTDKKPEIWILDRNPTVTTSDKRQATKLQTGKDYLKNLERFDIVYRSPGVPYNLPGIQKAIKAGVKISSPTALFFENFKGKIIGITGTKGKGTTATLLYKILKSCVKKVYLAGNIGKPAIELLSKIRINPPNQHKSAPIIIFELSSFQLHDLKKSPDISVILDVFPDHLDLHKNLREYFDAKTNIARWQKKSDKIFYFSDNRWSKWIAQKSRGKKIPVDSIFSNSRELENKIKEIIKIPGEHNLKNAVMATIVALSLGCPKDKILKVVKKFRGNEHRLELIRTIHGYARIRKQINTDKNKIRVHPRSHLRSSVCIKFYNDSASTNPQTAAAAIRAFKEPKILISGGKDKGLNYSPLARALKNSNTKLVILFGENKKKIRKAISNQEPIIREVKNLQQAVHLAYKTAKSMLHDTCSMLHIIFSPASASFDMFKDYADRGEKFKELVRKLK